MKTEQEWLQTARESQCTLVDLIRMIQQDAMKSFGVAQRRALLEQCNLYGSMRNWLQGAMDEARKADDQSCWRLQNLYEDINYRLQQAHVDLHEFDMGIAQREGHDEALPFVHEALAHEAHSLWARILDSAMGKIVQIGDMAVLPNKDIESLTRRMTTPYEWLPERDKAQFRDYADRILRALMIMGYT